PEICECVRAMCERLTGRYWRELDYCFQEEDGIRGRNVTGVQTCALPISLLRHGQPLEQHRLLRPRGAAKEAKVEGERKAEDGGEIGRASGRERVYGAVGARGARKTRGRASQEEASARAR